MISETHLSAIENDRIEIGVKRATLIGAALGISPELLLFPNGKGQYKQESEKVQKAASKLLAKKNIKYSKRFLAA